MVQSSLGHFVIFHFSLIKPSINKDKHKQVRHNSEGWIDRMNYFDMMYGKIAEVTQTSSQKRSPLLKGIHQKDQSK